MVAAAEFRRATAFLRHDQGAAMAAAVVQDMNAAIDMPRQNDGLATDPRAEIIARLLDLAFMTDIEPRPAEQARHLKLENSRIGVNPAVHPAGLHEIPDAKCIVQQTANPPWRMIP